MYVCRKRQTDNKTQNHRETTKKTTLKVQMRIQCQLVVEQVERIGCKVGQQMSELNVQNAKTYVRKI